MKNLFVLFAVIFIVCSTVSLAALKPDLELMTSLAKPIPEKDLAKIQRFLPAAINVKVTDTSEDIFILFDKDGKPKIPDEVKKIDVIVTSDEATYREFLAQNGFDQKKLVSYIEEGKIVLEPKSYRAKLLFRILEDKFKVKLNNKNSFTDSFFVYIPSKFMGMFIK